MKIYIVSGSYSDYEDYELWNLCAFKSHEKADELVIKLNSALERARTTIGSKYKLEDLHHPHNPDWDKIHTEEGDLDVLEAFKDLISLDSHLKGIHPYRLIDFATAQDGTLYWIESLEVLDGE